MLLAHYVSDVVAGLALGVGLDKVVGWLFGYARAVGDQNTLAAGGPSRDNLDIPAWRQHRRKRRL
jgi:membrane-associated phospholipid phosphatase